MRLTHFTDLSLRLLMYLAVKADGLATIQEVAERYGVSRNHLMKVTQGLVKHGFVASARGNGGGLRLQRPATEIRVGEVIRVTEDDFRLVECFEAGRSSCTLLPACRLKGVLGEALGAYLAVLDKYTLDDLTVPTHPMRRALGLPDARAA
ncbi:MAG: Rrf2 family transcriptional regulator [Devosia sp.]|uniref:Rrf2 family transcriptional regulator n=1 Tax=Devosia sp. TaxID=1871048 RepID=UPI001AD326DB|nr:Rrf2 family transcriptional regulator [Devosia sp.]MBN9310300.1 Rrf2 family transcriptional regulator [Devosia sp.]MBN9315457.1 Rrf2 family transcriptional regulator [Devosia sp.]